MEVRDITVDESFKLLDHKYVSDYDSNDDLIATIKEMKKVIKMIPRKKLEPVSLNKCIAEGRRFLIDNYRIQKIGYLPDDNRLLLNRIVNKLPISNEKKAFVYNNLAKRISPFELEVRTSRKFNPIVLYQMEIFEDYISDELAKLLDVFYITIYLDRNITEFTTTSYIHEILHTQAELHKGVIEDYNNGELIPILNELMYCDDCNAELINELLYFRLKLSLNSLDIIIKDKKNDEYYNHLKYILSTLRAYKTFIAYRNGNDTEKHEMKEQIQHIFDGDISVEEFLDSYNVDENNILEIDNVYRII